MLVLAKDAFWRVFNELRMPEPLPPQDFFLGKNTMDSLDACFQVSARVPKKFKVDLDWKGNHEELFSEKGLLWPPDDKQGILGMHERESEVVHLANHVFPGKTGGQWTFFDANHTAERLFALSAKPAKSSTDKAAKAGPVWKDPWKTFVPTLTGKSSIICRCLQPDGSVVLRKLHPLECFRMNLWDLCHWRCECFANLGLELELVHELDRPQLRVRPEVQLDADVELAPAVLRRVLEEPADEVSIANVALENAGPSPAEPAVELVSDEFLFKVECSF